MNLSCSDFSVFCVSLEMVGFYAFLDLVSCSYPIVEKETEFFAGRHKGSGSDLVCFSGWRTAKEGSLAGGRAEATGKSL